uniref:CSON003175 protein n=1 Tax=Culicoides sonorensis TaxID=179676 RepID=A0A336M4P7_CULSO
MTTGNSKNSSGYLIMMMNDEKLNSTVFNSQTSEILTNRQNHIECSTDMGQDENIQKYNPTPIMVRTTKK